MRRTLPPLALVALSLAVVAGACRGDLPEDDLPIRVRVAIAPTPPIVGPARLVITLVEEGSGEVEGAELRVEGTMEHAGMTPVHREAEPAEGGRYVIPDFDFTMGGDWILLVRIALPDGEEIVRRHSVRVYSGGPGGGPGEGGG